MSEEVEEVIVIDDDSARDDSAIAASVKVNAGQEVICIADSSSESSSESSSCEGLFRDVGHQHQTRAAVRRRRRADSAGHQIPAKHARTGAGPTVIQLRNDSPLSLDTSSSKIAGSVPETSANGSKVDGIEGRKPPAKRPAKQPSPTDSDISQKRSDASKRKRAAPKRFDSDDENSNFRRCPVCFSLIPRYNLESHAANCGMQTATSGGLSPIRSRVLQFDGRNSSLSIAGEDEVNMLRHDSDQNEQMKHSKLDLGSPENERSNSKQPEKTAHDEAHEALTKGGAKRRFASGVEVVSDLNSEWRAAVEEALRTVRRDARNRRSERLRVALLQKNELIRGSQPKTDSSTHLFPLLDEAEDRTLEFPVGESDLSDVPRDTFHTIFLKKHFQPPEDKSDAPEGAVADDDSSTEGTEHSSPMICGDKGSPEREFFASKIREFYMPDKIGVGYEEKDTDDQIDWVLEALQPLNYDPEKIHEYLALLLQEDVSRVQSRYDKLLERKTEQKNQRPPYEDLMSSFRDLFCNRCYTYDCNLHGLADDFCPQLQAELAIQKQMKGEWEVCFVWIFFVHVFGALCRFVSLTTLLGRLCIYLPTCRKSAEIKHSKRSRFRPRGHR